MPTLFSASTLAAIIGIAIKYGATFERLDRYVSNALTVQDGVRWEREAVAKNPSFNAPDIAEIHARNMDADSKSVLRR